ncbi:MAG: hypothetical protein VCA36_00900 [Opitutales bacterium]
MRKQSSKSTVEEYRFIHLWGDDVVPMERYFTAANPDEAIEIFAYTCLKTGRKPILKEFAQWNRWRQTWVPLPVPEREEYVVDEEALTTKLDELDQGDEENEESFKAVPKES